ncbi:MAG: RNA 2',3'-cyclic phosphodiesterase [Sinobacteraceae bacterium]|nr:RNA 2',3'-cyclic phosphodiesterase [Nevskiaceae bacterium]
MSGQRLFFAFWPDETTRVAVDAARQPLFPLSGHPVEAANLHVTVAFLGDVGADRLERLKTLAGPVAPFSITFDRLERWRKPGVLVATATRPAIRAMAIATALWQQLDRLGFARDPRPFVPHVTLARKVQSMRPELRWTAVGWTVDRIRLVESSRDAAGTLRYLPIA